jgi:hypothetical protein
VGGGQILILIPDAILIMKSMITTPYLSTFLAFHSSHQISSSLQKSINLGANLSKIKL